MNMNLLAVVTSPYIYHGCSTWKSFWEEKLALEGTFTLGKFTPTNMKNCGHFNVRKHRYIKDSDKYITLDILLKLVSLYKTRITSLEPKNYLRISGQGLFTSLGLKAKSRPNKYKKAGCTIVNFSKKDLSKIFREFEKLPYKSYEWRRPKHEPTESYFIYQDSLIIV